MRYGSATANALQRGLWTHTKRAIPFFDSITSGWIDYSHNLFLVKLFSHALVSSITGHKTALEEIKGDIAKVKQANQQTSLTGYSNGGTKRHLAEVKPIDTHYQDEQDKQLLSFILRNDYFL